MSKGSVNSSQVLFLFGAGASHGNPSCYPSPPPLGTQLFDALLEFSENAKRIPEPIARIFKGKNFEEGMAALYETRGELIAPFLRDMGHFFVRFEPGPDNYYRRIIGAARAKGLTGIYATLNYELLLEICLSWEGFDNPYRRIIRGIPHVLKLHGSCNFLADGPSFVNCRWSGYGQGIARGVGVKAVTLEEARLYYQSDESLPPIMSMYLFCKESVVGFEAIYDAWQIWQEATAVATAIFVVGTRLERKDTHIWKPIGMTSAPLYYVGFEDDEIRIWAAELGKQRVEVLGRTFEQAMPKILSLMATM